MKPGLLILLIFLTGLFSQGQVLIHAHNDYQKPEPLVNALKNRVYSIEADVFLVDDSLLVAHDKSELKKAPSLYSLYIKPISVLYGINHGRISEDNNYAPVLMIDIKEKGKEVIAALDNLLKPLQAVFDRAVNPHAVQVVISGDRGPVSKWKSYPSFIFFDGRPFENYDDVTMQRVAFISDSYFNYSRVKDSTSLYIQQLAEKIHQKNKLLRLWAIPDNALSWGHVKKLGVDIINTDDPEACRKYFSPPKQ